MSLSHVAVVVDIIAKLYCRSTSSSRSCDITFDWVLNCTTMLVQADQNDIVYQRFIYERSMLLATEAATKGVQVFVHLGSAMELSDGVGVFQIEDNFYVTVLYRQRKVH